jgi:hypothetical protein
MNMKAGVVALGLALALLAAAAEQERPAAGKPASGETKEDLLNRLKLEEAQLQVQQAAATRQRYEGEYAEMRRLFEEKTVTLKEFNDAKKNLEESQVALERARISLEKTKLDFLKNATHLSITEAKKYRTEDNRHHVDVTIRNSSNEDLARALMEAPDKTVTAETLRNLLKVDNIIVSLIDGAVIGEPYEIIVPSLANGEQKTVSFRLLKDVENLEVRMRYLDVSANERVFLKKESLRDLPNIVSAQVAQEGNLGSKVGYDLTLELLATEERGFGLATLGLPKQIQVTFMDPKTRARVTQVRFTDQISRQDLRLELSVPEKLDRKFVDKPMTFYVVVGKLQDLKQIEKAKGQFANGDMPAAEVEKLPGNRADLQLIPRGVGQLEVLVQNLYQEIKIGEKVQFQVQVLNSGTLPVMSVGIEAELPLNWNADTDPRRLPEILAGDKRPVRITLTPPADVSVGNYDIRIKGKGETGTEQVEAADKTFQVRVSAKSDILGTVTLVSVLILLVLGIAIVSIRISRH